MMMMMIDKASDDTQGTTFLQIKQDDRFFSRLLSKETSSSMAVPSFRVYYGGETVNVPFTWETKPGTPKHYTLDHRDHHHHHEDPTIFPPLTPPPSYCTTKMPTKSRGRCNSFRNLLPKILPKKTWRFSSSSSSSSQSSSSSEVSSSESSWKSTFTIFQLRMLRRSRSSTVTSTVQFDKGMEDEKIGPSSPTSTLCFGIKMQR